MSPLSNRGFLFTPGEVIDKDNPLQIINKKEGGYSSIFVRDDGYLQVAIGSISKKLGNKTDNIQFFEDAEMKFDTAVLSFEDTEVPEGKTVKYSEDKKITMAIDAKGRTSYTTVKKAFTLGNGVTVPAGAVIASIKETGVHEWHAEIGEYEHFRAYDPESGRLITSFGQKGLKNADCDGSKECFDVKQFVAEEGTGFNGQKIFYSFSTQQLGLGSDPYTSALAWTNIQQDLNQKIIDDLNAKDAQWQKEELKKLNKDLEIFTGNEILDNLTVNDGARIDELLDEYEAGGINALKT